MRRGVSLRNVVHDHGVAVFVISDRLSGSILTARNAVIYGYVYHIDGGSVLTRFGIISCVAEVTDRESADDIRTLNLLMIVICGIRQEGLYGHFTRRVCSELPSVSIERGGELRAGGFIGAVYIRYGDDDVAHLQIGAEVGHTRDVHAGESEQIHIEHPLAVRRLIDDVPAVVAHKTVVFGVHVVYPDAHNARDYLHNYERARGVGYPAA